MMTYGGGEQVLYQDTNAYVSRSRLVLAGTTYPIGSISSVRACALGRDWSALTSWWGIWLSLATCGLWVPIGVFIALVQGERFALFIGTSGGERRAMLSGNGVHIQTLATAINQALALR